MDPLPTESSASDAYEAVLADLRAKREQIDQAIKAIEFVRGSGVGAPPQTPTPSTNATQTDNPTSVSPGMFLGMSIADASKRLLAIRKRTLSNAEIVAGIQSGGVALSAKTDPQNIVGSVLTRRFQQVGDVVRVSRGQWGLKEWYPGKSFKPATRNGDETKPSSTEQEQPSGPIPVAPKA